MAKALMGTFTTPRAEQLLAEVRALRARVEQLESALADAEAARDARLGTAEEADTVVALDEAVGAPG